MTYKEKIWNSLHMSSVRMFTVRWISSNLQKSLLAQQTLHDGTRQAPPPGAKAWQQLVAAGRGSRVSRDCGKQEVKQAIRNKSVRAKIFWGLLKYSGDTGFRHAAHGFSLWGDFKDTARWLPSARSLGLYLCATVREKGNCTDLIAKAPLTVITLE